MGHISMTCQDKTKQDSKWMPILLQVCWMYKDAAHHTRRNKAVTCRYVFTVIVIHFCSVALATLLMILLVPKKALCCCLKCKNAVMLPWNIAFSAFWLRFLPLHLLLRTTSLIICVCWPPNTNNMWPQSATSLTVSFSLRGTHAKLT